MLVVRDSHSEEFMLVVGVEERDCSGVPVVVSSDVRQDGALLPLVFPRQFSASKKKKKSGLPSVCSGLR